MKINAVGLTVLAASVTHGFVPRLSTRAFVGIRMTPDDGIDFATDITESKLLATTTQTVVVPSSVFLDLVRLSISHESSKPYHLYILLEGIHHFC